MTTGKPSVFSRWMRGHLKDAYSGLITQDIDFFVRNDQNNTFFLSKRKPQAGRVAVRHRRL